MTIHINTSSDCDFDYVKRDANDTEHMKNAEYKDNACKPRIINSM